MTRRYDAIVIGTGQAGRAGLKWATQSSLLSMTVPHSWMLMHSTSEAWRPFICLGGLPISALHQEQNRPLAIPAYRTDLGHLRNLRQNQTVPSANDVSGNGDDRPEAT
jgi:hypothetical protein